MPSSRASQRKRWPDFPLHIRETLARAEASLATTEAFLAQREGYISRSVKDATELMRAACVAAPAPPPPVAMARAPRRSPSVPDFPWHEARELDAAAAAHIDDLALAELTDVLLADPNAARAVDACYERLHAYGHATLPAGLVQLYAWLLARAGRRDDAQYYQQYSAQLYRDEDARFRAPSAAPSLELPELTSAQAHERPTETCWLEESASPMSCTSPAPVPWPWLLDDDL